jgi:DNA-binding transcriptional LysR family regulator
MISISRSWAAHRLTSTWTFTRSAIIPHVIIAPTSHRLVRKSRVPLSDLADETFLTREPGSGTRGLMEQLFETRAFGRKSAWR